MRITLGVLLSLVLALTATSPATATAAGQAHAPAKAKKHLAWKHVDVNTTQQFRGLAAVDARTAWVGGSKGGVWLTTNAGRRWHKVGPRGAKGLLFRDVEATDARHAQVLAIGEGRDSRIYRTANGGRTWHKTFVNTDPAAFYDCMAMWPDGRHGIAMSDPVDGRFRIISTRDGGRSWHVLRRRGMPAAVDGEFGFAASGTCLVTSGHKRAYLGSGGAASRVFVTKDRGRHWKVRDSTIPASDAGGVFSLAFSKPRVGIAVGGDFEAEDVGTDASAFTRTAGRHWRNRDDLGGYRSGVDYRHGRVAVAVGPSGSDITHDNGRRWHTFSDTGFDAVQCVDSTCWASGPDGSVARLVRR